MPTMSVSVGRNFESICLSVWDHSFLSYAVDKLGVRNDLGIGPTLFKGQGQRVINTTQLEGTRYPEFEPTPTPSSY